MTNYLATPSHSMKCLWQFNRPYSQPTTEYLNITTCDVGDNIAQAIYPYSRIARYLCDLQTEGILWVLRRWLLYNLIMGNYLLIIADIL